MRAPAALAVALLAAIACLGGCGPQLTPEEEVELLRSQYNAELTSMTVVQDPQKEAAEEGAEPDADAVSGLDLDEPAVQTDVVLDILVSTTSDTYLPGITIDLQHVDGQRNEKDLRTLWVDTSTLVRGGGTQVTHLLEDVDYVAGDGFWVEVRSPIGVEERRDYREFAVAP